MRVSWQTYFMNMAIHASTRSTCTRRQIGAVLVRENHIVSTGYNGSPKGQAHCLDVGCLRDELSIPSGTQHEICRAAHAEQNALAQAAYHGITTKDTILYCTASPCSICAKMLINAGIREIYYMEEYTDECARKILMGAGVCLIHKPEKLEFL